MLTLKDGGYLIFQEGWEGQLLQLQGYKIAQFLFPWINIAQLEVPRLSSNYALHITSSQMYANHSDSKISG